MKELSSKEFNGDWEEYKAYVKRVAIPIENILFKHGFKIEYRIYPVDGTIMNPNNRKELIRKYNRYMEMEISKNENVYKTSVKKSVEDANDDEFMYALGLYRIYHKMKRDSKKMKKKGFGYAIDWNESSTSSSTLTLDTINVLSIE